MHSIIMLKISDTLSLLLYCDKFYKMASGVLTNFNLDNASDLITSLHYKSTIAIQNINYSPAKYKEISDIEKKWVNSEILIYLYSLLELISLISLCLSNFNNTKNLLKNLKEQYTFFSDGKSKQYTHSFFVDYNLTDEQVFDRLEKIQIISQQAGNISNTSIFKNLYNEEPGPEESIKEFQDWFIKILRYIEKIFDLVGEDINFDQVISALHIDVADALKVYEDPENDEIAMLEAMDEEDRDNPEMIDRMRKGTYF